jgi:hypothetical protein
MKKLISGPLDQVSELKKAQKHYFVIIFTFS